MMAGGSEFVFLCVFIIQSHLLKMGMTMTSASPPSPLSIPQSNFLQNFLTAHLPRPGRRSSLSSASQAALWLRLLLNVSFGEDGQQMLLKLHGSLELLTELAQTQTQNPRQNQNQNQRQASASAAKPKPTALLILHNICFSSANKPKVLANGMGPLITLITGNKSSYLFLTR